MAAVALQLLEGLGRWPYLVADGVVETGGVKRAVDRAWGVLAEFLRRDGGDQGWIEVERSREEDGELVAREGLGATGEEEIAEL